MHEQRRLRQHLGAPARGSAEPARLSPGRRCGKRRERGGGARSEPKAREVGDARTGRRLKSIYETSDRAIAQLLCSALESEGIGSIVDGEHLSSLQGLAVPAGSSAQYRVCIVDPEQMPVARSFAEKWLQQLASREAAGSWTCQGCGEIHDGQFSSCWRCGAEADPSQERDPR